MVGVQGQVEGLVRPEPSSLSPPGAVGSDVVRPTYVDTPPDRSVPFHSEETSPRPVTGEVERLVRQPTVAAVDSVSLPTRRDSGFHTTELPHTPPSWVRTRPLPRPKVERPRD